jgi:aminopeptidase N
MLNEASVLGAASHQKLNYTYDSLLLHIYLGKEFKRDENYTVFIDYTSKPEELGDGAGGFLTDKGLTFVNADGKNSDKPVQFWTEGEPESNSTWFPTIENPSQKMTQEIYITVDSHFVSLSNGLLISSTKNADGTRTDYWKQSLPAAPYLTSLTVSDYAVVKDHWRNIEVNYYLNKDYEKYARMIFGNTPEMLEHFSKLLGVDYPWEKFSQVIATDHNFGSMENTSSVVWRFGYVRIVEQPSAQRKFCGLWRIPLARIQIRPRSG